ncbi:transposase [Rhodocytophaga rosea]|uniref:Transposase n=1 Tax=Rhodocytophaga rosea TaxID=2704465 RepID=A0A6C0GS11_9BACT|nr:transposase [Rhodocytophaga rosea]
MPIQRKRKYDLREIVNAILWYLRIGSQWRNLPEGFPKWQNRSGLKAVVGKFTTILGNGTRMALWKDSTGV